MGRPLGFGIAADARAAGAAGGNAALSGGAWNDALAMVVCLRGERLQAVADDKRC